MTHVYRQSGRTIVSLVVASLSFLFSVLFIILPVGMNFYWKIAVPLVSALVCVLSLLAFFKRMQKMDACFIKERQLTVVTRKSLFFESHDPLAKLDKKSKKYYFRECKLDDLAGFALCNGKELLEGPYLTDQNVRKDIEPSIHTMFLFGGFAFAGVANLSTKRQVMIPQEGKKHQRDNIPSEDREAFMAMQRYLVLKLKNGHEWILNAEGYTSLDLLALVSELENLTGIKALCPTPVEAIDYPTYEKKFWKLTMSYGISALSFAIATSLVLLLVPSPSNGVYYFEALMVFLSCVASIFFAMLLGISYFDGKKALPRKAKKYSLWNGIMLLLVLTLIAFVVKII